MDVRARRDGFGLIFNLNELDVPSIYSSMFTNFRGLKERPALVQRFVAALAEAIHFVKKIPIEARPRSRRFSASPIKRFCNPPTMPTPSHWSTGASSCRRTRSRERSRQRARMAQNQEEARRDHSQQFRRALGPQRFSQGTVGQPILKIDPFPIFNKRIIGA